MTFLPIVDRELRVAARRRGTYWLRSGAGLAATLTLLWIWMGELFQRIPGTGARVFALLSWGALLFCLVAGAVFTADAVSEEKREGTLGLLFLTPLRGYDVILGKLVGGALGALYGLVAILPVLAVPLVLGGVTHGVVLRTFLSLLAALFLSVSLGILVSTIGRRERVTIGLTLSGMVAMTFGLIPLSRFNLGVAWSALPGWSLWSPAVCLVAAQEAANGGNEQFFWQAWQAQMALSCALVGVACVLVRHAFEERGSMFKGAFPGGHTTLQFRNPPRQRVNPEEPYRWMANRGGLSGIPVWLVLGILAAAGMTIRVTLQGSPWGWVVCLATLLLIHGGVKLWFISESVHRLAEDRRLGTLELLLNSRVPPPSVIGSLKATLKQRSRMAASFVVLSTILTWSTDAVFDGGALSEWTMAGLFVLFIDLATIRTVGPWVGLCTARTSRAVIQGAWRLLVVPWLVFGALLLLFGLEWRHGFSLGNAWLVICVLNNLVWWSHAAAGLRQDYVQLATARSGQIPAATPTVEIAHEPERGVASLFHSEPALYAASQVDAVAGFSGRRCP